MGVGYDGSPECLVAWIGRSLSPSPSAPPSTFCALGSPRRFARPASRTESTGAPSAPKHLEDTPEGLVAAAVAELGNGATGEAVAGVARDELVRLLRAGGSARPGLAQMGPAAPRAVLGSCGDRIVHGAACRVVIVPRGASTRSTPRSTRHLPILPPADQSWTDVESSHRERAEPDRPRSTPAPDPGRAGLPRGPWHIAAPASSSPWPCVWWCVCSGRRVFRGRRAHDGGGLSSPPMAATARSGGSRAHRRPHPTFRARPLAARRAAVQCQSWGSSRPSGSSSSWPAAAARPRHSHGRAP